MPEKVFHEGEISLRTGADPGAANLAVQGQRALEAMALPEANKRWCQEKYIAATFGAQAVAKALNPVDATSDIKSARLALMENSDMGEGNPLPVDPQDNHAAHAPQHLMPVEVIVDAFSQTGRVDPNGLIALQNAIPHLEQHFEFLKADKMQEQLFKELWPRFTAAKSGAEGIFRMVERMQQNVQQGGSPTPPGGLDPAAQVGATTLQ